MTTQDMRLGLESCSRCRRWLDPAAFRPNPKLHSGLDSWCKRCHVEATRAWIAAHPEAREAYNERRRRTPLDPRSCATCGQDYRPVRVDQRYCPACKSKRTRRVEA